jgi:hypothetical protein
MTTTAIAQTQNRFSDGLMVMVRGFKSRAYRVMALAASKTTVCVSGSENSPGIGYPTADVFNWNEKLFNELQDAPEKDSRDELWASAVPFVPSSLPKLVPAGHLDQRDK